MQLLFLGYTPLVLENFGVRVARQKGRWMSKTELLK